MQYHRNSCTGLNQQALVCKSSIITKGRPSYPFSHLVLKLTSPLPVLALFLALCVTSARYVGPGASSFTATVCPIPTASAFPSEPGQFRSIVPSSLTAKSTTASLPLEDEDNKYDVTIVLDEVRGVSFHDDSFLPATYFLNDIARDVYETLNIKTSNTETTDPSGSSSTSSPPSGTPSPLSPDDIAIRSGYRSRSNPCLFYRRHPYANTSSPVFSTISCSVRRGGLSLVVIKRKGPLSCQLPSFVELGSIQPLWQF